MLRRATAIALALLTLCVTAKPVAADAPNEWLQASPDARTAVTVALWQIGIDYKYAANDPEIGFDCSGLIQYVYEQVDIKLPGNSAAQIRETEAVQTPLPGDLVYYPGHVMLYIGDGQIVHAPSSGETVRIDDLPDRDDLRFGRVVDHDRFQSDGISHERPVASSSIVRV